eukprot:gnl/MRDRNA2_/MRDRNA2_79025_c0_seq4.p1 gnl/MRDRNA2_/MRDRNA2_79025_c0~~gnl/MRDRNA2_/MRDRNA2_79025_c0_seq4.p1  ORF type:complete len:1886 (+),score=324.25 gnl/MRDRNA2_/MRDRNA2_79025_c0_seq4:134-5791(+)
MASSRCETSNLKPATVLPVQDELTQVQTWLKEKRNQLENVQLDEWQVSNGREPLGVHATDAVRLLLSLQAPELAQVISQVLQVRWTIWETLFASARAGSSPREGLENFIKNPSASQASQVDQVQQVQYAQKSEELEKQNAIPTIIPLNSGITSKAKGVEFIDPLPPPEGSQIKDLPIVQFSTAFYYCQESDEEMVIDIMRLGDLQKTCSVKYETRDSSAKAGKKYVKASGLLVFEPGEMMKDIRVKILTDDSWDATLEFEVFLSEPVDAELGRYLYICRGLIIDDDAFPSNRFAGELLSGYIDKVSEFGLLWEYFKMNYSIPVVRKGTNKAFAIDQLHSCYFILRLFLMRHLFNVVIDTDVSSEHLILFKGHRDLELVAIMAFIIVPFAVLHYLEIYKCNNKVGGTCRKHIQENLLRKYLNYDENSRSKVAQSDLVMAMTRDTIEVVHTGYAKIFPLAANLGRLCIVLLYQTIPPVIRGVAPNPVAVLPILVFPGAMWIFLKLRMSRTVEVAHAADERQNEIVRHVGETVSKYRLIADYNRRPYFVDRGTEKIKAFNKAAVLCIRTNVNNKYFAPWLSTVAVGLYIIYGGLQVIDESLELGDFLVNLEIFKAIGVALAAIFGVLLDMQSSLEALKRIVTFMNLPVDVKNRMHLNRQRRKFGRQEALMALETDSPASNSLDVVDTMLLKVDIRYKFSNFFDGLAVRCVIEQGNFVAIVGQHSKGKSTMLKLLAGVLIPDSGFAIPPHLRVLHVSERPLFISGTLLQNLLFGVKKGDDDGDTDRVREICQMLRLPKKILALIDSKECMQWGEVLSLTEKVSLNIARALIANPEILCMHQPTLAFDDLSAKNMLALLQKYVTERGLVQDPTKILRRRPRTCIISTCRSAGVEMANQVFIVDGMSGVREVDKTDPNLFQEALNSTVNPGLTAQVAVATVDTKHQSKSIPVRNDTAQEFVVSLDSSSTPVRNGKLKENVSVQLSLTITENNATTVTSAQATDISVMQGSLSSVRNDDEPEIIAMQEGSSVPTGHEEAKEVLAVQDSSTPVWNGTGIEADQQVVQRKEEQHEFTESGSASAPPIIQFSTSIYYCTELEGKMVLDISRLGNPQVRCSAKYETRDSSAKAGKKYHHTAGTVHFAPGEIFKELCVPLINDDSWDATLEFEVVLSEPKDAILGRYLYTCRAKIVDDDCFPTNRFGKEVSSGELDQVPSFPLLLEYFKANYGQGKLRGATHKQLTVEQFQNLYFIARLFLTQYLINNVINTEVDADGLMLFPGRRDLVLVAIMVMIILPFAIVHYIDFTKPKFGVGGGSRVWIQQNLLRKFLNYDEESRCEVKDSDLVMAMSRDTVDLTGNGYGKLFPLMKNLGMLCFILLYQIIAPLSEGRKPNPVVVAPVLLFPAFMIIFLKLRNEKTMTALHCRNTTQNELVEHVGETVSMYRLIADYYHRPHFVDLFTAKIASFNKAWVAAAKVKTTNKYLPKWVSTVIVGAYTIYGGLQVINHEVKLGDFIVNLEIFQEIGVAWTAIYVILLDMQGTFPALKRIVRFMNLQVDVPKRMKLNRQRRNDGLFERAEAHNKFYGAQKEREGSSSYFQYAIDTVPIKVGVNWMFAQGLQGISASCTIQQGSFVALVGHSCTGKATMLKLLGSVLLPESGIFIPPHLRALHVSEAPLFFDGTLLQNLCFGVDDRDSDASLERVIAIAKMLYLPEKIISLIESTEIKPWGEILSMTEKILLNLARAFITNPEMLLMHKPSLAFDDATAYNTILLLQRYVKEKGLVQDMSQISLRRPRTCIITAGRPAGVELADQVLLVDSKKGVQEIDKASVTPELLGCEAKDVSVMTALTGLKKLGRSLTQAAEIKRESKVPLIESPELDKQGLTVSSEAEVPLID